VDNDQLFQYKSEFVENHEAVSRAIYKLEIERLGLEDSTLLFPGSNTDLHINIATGLLPIGFFRSKVFVSKDVDIDGNSVPVLAGLRYFKQNWEVGGAYLQPEEIDGDQFA